MKFISFALFMAAASATSAQSMMTATEMRRLRDDHAVRIQSNLSFSVPVVEDADLAGQQQAATRIFYKLVAGSCELVTSSIGDSCSVTNVTSNVNMIDRRMAGQPVQITVNGQITMEVKLKDSTGKTP